MIGQDALMVFVEIPYMVVVGTKRTEAFGKAGQPSPTLYPNPLIADSVGIAFQC